MGRIVGTGRSLWTPGCLPPAASLEKNQMTEPTEATNSDGGGD